MKFKKRYVLIPITIIIVLLTIFRIIMLPVMGNPFVKMIEYPKMKSYIAEKYPGLDLTVGFPFYGHNGGYGAVVYSKNDKLIRFNMWKDNNGGYFDGYESVVLSGYTTTNEWQDEYDKIIRNLLKDMSSSNLTNSSTWILGGGISFGDTFDLNRPLTLVFNLYFEEADFSPEKLSQIILESFDIITSQGMEAEKYSFNFRRSDTSWSEISDITSEYMNDDLIELIREMQNDSQGVYMRTKIGSSFKF